MDQRTIRRHNLGLILTHVARVGPRSRALLARETGLNKTTVSSLVAELIEAGLLAECDGARSGGVGRPSQALELDGRRLVALGVELDAAHIALTALDLCGVLRHQVVVEQDNRSRGTDDLVATLARVAESALDSIALQRLEPVGITVAVPGLVEFDSGTVMVAPSLHLTDVPLAARISAALDRSNIALHVDNEANLGAVAEMGEGIASNCSHFLYISAGVGIGAGVVIDGELYRGARGFSGEFGHMTIERDGPVCACGGRGCLEVYAGLSTLVRLAGIQDRPTDSRSVVAVLAERARARNGVVLRALEGVGRALGVGVASLANVFDPRMIVLGGYVAELAEWILPPLEAELSRRVVSRSWELAPSALGRDAPSRGASRMALREVLEDPASAIAAARGVRARAAGAASPLR